MLCKSDKPSIIILLLLRKEHAEMMQASQGKRVKRAAKEIHRSRIKAVPAPPQVTPMTWCAPQCYWPLSFQYRNVIIIKLS